MQFNIDHVTLDANNLDMLGGEFVAAGMTPNYGGVHSSGLTHMSLLGFTDGSYIELISTTTSEVKGARWGQHITTNAGPCAWAVQVSDIAAKAARLVDKGVPVDGPIFVQRQRPDGVQAEWDLAFVGSEGPGALHPFLIEDRTPKSHRVQVAESVIDGPLIGVAMVIIAVANLEATISVFREIYGLEPPVSVSCSTISETLWVFPGEPLALVSSDSEDTWLARRIQRFGPSPCAYLLRATDLVEAQRRYGFVQPGNLGQTKAFWLKSPLLRMGVCEADIF